MLMKTYREIAGALVPLFILLAIVWGCESRSLLVSEPPPAPVLASPLNGAIDLALSPMLSWNAVRGAVMYRLQISADSGFSTVVFEDSVTIAACRRVGSLLHGTKYFWRVNASNSAGTGKWSHTWSFTTGNRPPVPIALKVLFIGNSLTFVNDLPATVSGIATADGQRIAYHTTANPGFALVDHLDGGSDAVDQVKQGGWDFVILQQGPSSLPDSRVLLIDGTQRFDQYIRAVGATTALYMVWPDKSRYAFFEDVRVSYKLAADTVGGLFLPAGEAWLTAWQVDSTLPFYGPDNFHPSPLGTYLAALVIYERITGRDVRNLPPQVVVNGQKLDVSEATVRLLQLAAHVTNSRYETTGLIYRTHPY